MRRFVLAALALAALAVTAPALADVKISDRPYVRHDGGTDLTIAAVLDEQPASRTSRPPRSHPHNPLLMTAGANDYCPVPILG